MYKVFVNDRPIIFTSSLTKEEDYPLLNVKNITINNVIKQVKTGKLKGVLLYSDNLQNYWEFFCEKYNVIEAGGGLVVNEEEELLFIYRGNKWDLPKGRIEKGEQIEETAIREVEEECGITEVYIKQFLVHTYHFYIEEGKMRLKKIHWYLMYTKYNGVLKPLKSEGIKKAMFVNEEELSTILQNTYTNVKTVYNVYFTL